MYALFVVRDPARQWAHYTANTTREAIPLIVRSCTYTLFVVAHPAHPWGLLHEQHGSGSELA